MGQNILQIKSGWHTLGRFSLRNPSQMMLNNWLMTQNISSTLVCPTYSSWIPLHSTSLKWNRVEYAYIKVFIPVQYVSVQFIPVHSSPLLSGVLWSRVFQSSPFQSIPVYSSLLCFSPVQSIPVHSSPNPVHSSPF